MKLATHWVCVAHRWAVPTVECDARGDTYRAGDKHCTETRHPIVTTTRLELADRLAWVDPATAETSVWCQDEKHERCRGADGCVCGCHERDAAWNDSSTSSQPIQPASSCERCSPTLGAQPGGMRHSST